MGGCFPGIKTVRQVMEDVMAGAEQVLQRMRELG
jgi:hypothetical protein